MEAYQLQQLTGVGNYNEKQVFQISENIEYKQPEIIQDTRLKSNENDQPRKRMGTNITFLLLLMAKDLYAYN